MKLSALLLAAAAATVLAPAALAQTTNTTGASSTTTTSTTTTGGRGATVTTAGSAPGAMNPAPQTAQPAPMSSGMNATGGGMNTTGSMDATGAPTSGGAFRPLPATSGQDIVATLQASGQFGTFLKIADATSLTSVLKGTQGITVFAPTDAAFAALPAASMDLKDQATLQKLQTLLTYHIVNTKVPPLAGHGPTPVTTVAGPKVTLDGSGPNVKINDANALQSQITASNGVIYPIDKVLSPDYVPPPVAAPAPDATPTPAKKKSTKKRHTS